MMCAKKCSGDKHAFSIGNVQSMCHQAKISERTPSLSAKEVIAQPA